MSSSCTRRTKMEVTSDGKDLPCIPKEELKVDVLKAKKTKTKRPDKVKTATTRLKAEGDEEQEKERREKKFVSIKDEWERKSNKTSGINEKGKDYVKKKKKANIDDDKVSTGEDLYRNWKAIVDPSSGKTYYYNRVTKKKTREKPLRYNDDRNATSSAAAMKAKKTDRKKKYGLGDDCKVLSGSKIYAATEAEKANEKNEDKKKKKKKSKDGSLSQKQRDDASLVSHKKRKEKAKKKASRSSQSSEDLEKATASTEETKQQRDDESLDSHKKKKEKAKKKVSRSSKISEDLEKATASTEEAMQQRDDTSLVSDKKKKEKKAKKKVSRSSKHSEDLTKATTSTEEAKQQRDDASLVSHKKKKEKKAKKKSSRSSKNSDDQIKATAPTEEAKLSIAAGMINAVSRCSSAAEGNPAIKEDDILTVRSIDKSNISLSQVDTDQKKMKTVSPPSSTTKGSFVSPDGESVCCPVCLPVDDSSSGVVVEKKILKDGPNCQLQQDDAPCALFEKNKIMASRSSENAETQPLETKTEKASTKATPLSNSIKSEQNVTRKNEDAASCMKTTTSSLPESLSQQMAPVTISSNKGTIVSSSQNATMPPSFCWIAEQISPTEQPPSLLWLQEETSTCITSPTVEEDSELELGRTMHSSVNSEEVDPPFAQIETVAEMSGTINSHQVSDTSVAENLLNTVTAQGGSSESRKGSVVFLSRLGHCASPSHTPVKIDERHEKMPFQAAQRNDGDKVGCQIMAQQNLENPGLSTCNANCSSLNNGGADPLAHIGALENGSVNENSTPVANAMLNTVKARASIGTTRTPSSLKGSVSFLGRLGGGLRRSRAASGREEEQKEIYRREEEQKEEMYRRFAERDWLGEQQQDQLSSPNSNFFNNESSNLPTAITHDNEDSAHFLV